MTLPQRVTVSAHDADAPASAAPAGPRPVLRLLISMPVLTLPVLALLFAVGAGPLGAAVAAGNALAVLLLLARAQRRAGRDALGPADRVTLARALLGAAVTGLVADGMLPGPSGAPTAALVAVAGVALALDAVDGAVARRTGTASAVGARFDMEADAWLLMVLSVHVATALGPWVLAIGLTRYAFVAAGWALPWLRGALTPARGSKAIAALQGVALAAVASGLLGSVAGTAVIAAAMALLAFSFGRDVLRLRRAASAARVAAARIPLQRTSDDVSTVTARADRADRDAAAPRLRRARAGHADVCDPVVG